MGLTIRSLRHNLTLAPSTGSTFPDAVALSASGGPTGSTITVNPPTIAAGAGSTDVTVTVQARAAGANVQCLGTRSLDSTDGNARTAVRHRTRSTVREASAPRGIVVDRSHFDRSDSGLRRWDSHHFHDDDNHPAKKLHHNGDRVFRQRISFNQPHPYSAVRVSMMWHLNPQPDGRMRLDNHWVTQLALN